MRFTIIPLCFLLFLFSACGGEGDTKNTSLKPAPATTAKEAMRTDNLNLFKAVPKEKSGIDFVNQITETKDFHYFMYDAMYQGAGVGVGDFNNDGLADIFFTGNQVGDRLYLNKGDMKFEDITQSAGIIQDDTWSMGVAIADVNADGWLDIYVCKFLYPEEDKRRNRLYINNKDNTFSEQAAQWGIDDPAYSIQATFFDYDKDGDLDLYVGNQPPNLDALKKQLGSKKHFEYTDHFFRNDGNMFTNITKESGITNYSFTLSTTVSDLNNDGWLDIYIGSDYEEPDFYYQNNGDGTFINIANEALRHMSNFSMGCDVADFNNDGWPDIYCPDMVANDNFRLKSNMSGMNPQKFWSLARNGYHFQYMFNSLQRNNGNGTFSEIAQMAGVSNTDWSWTALMADLDNDGYKDILITNGLMRDMSNNDFLNKTKKLIAEKRAEYQRTGIKPDLDILGILATAPSNRIKNFVFQNNKDLTFNDLSDTWGFNFAGWTHGAAFADFDNDGDLDVICNNLNDVALLYENTLADHQVNNFLRIKLIGTHKDTYAYGARATIHLPDGTQQMQELVPVRGYVSSSEPILHFGLGNAPVVESVQIRWTNGQISELKDVPVNQVMEINQAEAKATQYAYEPPATFFALSNNNPLIPFKHQENAYDDYIKEILLPYKLSHLGPKVAKADINNDGLDDIYITGAAGQAGAMYLQQKEGAFKEVNRSLWASSAASEELNATFFDADGDNDLDLYVVCGGNEFEANDPLYQDRLYINTGNGNFKKGKLPKLTGSHSVAAAGDMDGDGDLDLFVGCRNIPGRYGHTGESVLLENNKGVFTKVKTEDFAPGLADIGMVSDAQWFDYNKDGKEDLLIVGEWMPLSIFQNEGKALRNVTQDLGLANTSGWWNTATLADIDQDGDIDIVAGNLGTNIKYKASASKPFKLYVKDFDENGSNDVYLGYYDSDGVCYPVRGRECSSQQMPFVKKEFKTYTEFAKADIESVLGKRKEGAVLKEAKLFETSYIENQGDKFVVHKLPNDAQVSTVQGIAVMDVNRDGHLDLIMAGNFYHREVETTRSDASVGCILLGDGKGNFKAVPPYQAGLKAYKDVRDIALLKTASGKPTLLVANNNDGVEYYRLQDGGVN